MSEPLSAFHSLQCNISIHTALCMPAATCKGLFKALVLARIYSQIHKGSLVNNSIKINECQISICTINTNKDLGLGPHTGVIQSKEYVPGLILFNETEIKVVL